VRTPTSSTRYPRAPPRTRPTARRGLRATSRGLLGRSVGSLRARDGDDRRDRRADGPRRNGRGPARRLLRPVAVRFSRSPNRPRISPRSRQSAAPSRGPPATPTTAVNSSSTRRPRNARRRRRRGSPSCARKTSRPRNRRAFAAVIRKLECGDRFGPPASARARPAPSRVSEAGGRSRRSAFQCSNEPTAH